MLKYIFAFILLIALTLLGITVGANNDQIITFNYMIAKSEMKLSTLVAILFGFGVFIGWLISMIFYVKLKIKSLNQGRQLKRQSADIEKLTQPNKAK